MRAWIEHGYKLLKSAGWHWDQTRMTDCDRAERLWLVLAVATRYVLAVGGDFEARQEVPVETIPELAPAAATGSAAGTTTVGSVNVLSTGTLTLTGGALRTFAINSGINADGTFTFNNITSVSPTASQTWVINGSGSTFNSALSVPVATAATKKQAP